MSLFTPDDFKNEWYGWATNQWSHVVLGQVLFGWIMYASLLFGEFAPRLDVLLIVAGIYAAWELFTSNRSKIWDSIEDFIFVVIYGAGWMAAVFTEVAPGLSGVYSDALSAIPLFGLFAFHTTVGVLLRWNTKGRA